MGFKQAGLIDVEPPVAGFLPLAEAVAAFDPARDRTRSIRTRIVLHEHERR